MARGKSERGQSLVEVALFIPIVIVLFLAIGDLARIFATMITVESAAREAADWAAYRPGNWATGSDPAVCGGQPAYECTVQEMERRARAAASSLTDYRPPGDPDGTNLSFECFFGTGDPADGCRPPGCDPMTDATSCASYGVKVRLTYSFDLIAPSEFVLLPSTITFTRDSTFALGKDQGGTP